MSTRSKHGSKVAVHQDLCEGCLQRKSNHPDPTRPRYCKKHQCPAEEAPGRPCSMRKKSVDDFCSSHYVVPCKMDACKAPSFDGSLHCELHSCSYRGCQKDARPGKGFEFCEDHKCSDMNCQSGRKRVEVDGALRLEPYCRRHECQINGCRSKKYPDKGYCVAHCCNVDGCSDKREGGAIGALCGNHYDEKVGKKKVEEYEIQKAAEERKKAAKEAKEKEEQEELRRQILEEAEQERIRQEAREAKAVREAKETIEAKAAKERDRSPKTTYSSGRDSGVSFYDQPHIRREAKVVYVYSDDDEAYVSSSGAGRHEEYVPVDRTGRTGVNVREAYQTHTRARRPSSGELHEDYLGHVRTGRGGW